MTLVDSSAAADLRRARKWSEVYKKIPAFDLYQGIPELFLQLGDQEIPTCIVTSSPRTYCECVLEHFRIQPNFCVCYHDTQNHKPHPDPIRTALKKLNVEPSGAFYLGDEPEDILASRAAGVPAFAALWGGQKRSELETIAGESFQTPRELGAYIANLTERRSLHRSIGRFYCFTNEDLDRASNLNNVFSLGYRYSGPSYKEHAWTKIVDGIKNNEDTSYRECESRLVQSILDLDSLKKPILVIPILGSRETETIGAKPIPRMAKALGKLDGYVYSSRLLYKKEPYRPLKNLGTKERRDAEVEGKFSSRIFSELQLNRPGTVLLVDDILTRGTTMNDAARAITESNGEVPVYGVVLAKAETSPRTATAKAAAARQRKESVGHRVSTTSPVDHKIFKELLGERGFQEGEWVMVSMGPAKFLGVVTRVVGKDKLIVDLYPMRRKEEVPVSDVKRTDKRPPGAGGRLGKVNVKNRIK